MELGVLPWPLCFFKVVLNFVHTIDIQGRGLFFGHILKNMFKIGLGSDVYVISFQTW